MSAVMDPVWSPAFLSACRENYEKMLAQQRAAGLPEGMLQLPPGMLPHMLPNGQLVPPPTPQQIAAARAAAGLAPLTLGAGSGGAMAAMGTAMLAQHASAAGSVCAADGSPLETLMFAIERKSSQQAGQQNKTSQSQSQSGGNRRQRAPALPRSSGEEEAVRLHMGGRLEKRPRVFSPQQQQFQLQQQQQGCATVLLGQHLQQQQQQQRQRAMGAAGEGEPGAQSVPLPGLMGVPPGPFPVGLLPPGLLPPGMLPPGMLPPGMLPPGMMMPGPPGTALPLPYGLLHAGMETGDDAVEETHEALQRQYGATERLQRSVGQLCGLLRARGADLLEVAACCRPYDPRPPDAAVARMLTDRVVVRSGDGTEPRATRIHLAHQVLFTDRLASTADKLADLATRLGAPADQVALARAVADDEMMMGAQPARQLGGSRGAAHAQQLSHLGHQLHHPLPLAHLEQMSAAPHVAQQRHHQLQQPLQHTQKNQPHPQTPTQQADANASQGGSGTGTGELDAPATFSL